MGAPEIEADFDVRTTGLNSKLVLMRKRRQFTSRLGPADRVFCVSCGEPDGFAAIDSPCITLCQDCVAKGLSLPLVEVENVTIYCGECHAAQLSVPRDIAGKVLYVCNPCEQKLGAKLPLEEMTPKEKSYFGIRSDA